MIKEEAGMGVASFETTHNFLTGENQCSPTFLGLLGQVAVSWSRGKV